MTIRSIRTTFLAATTILVATSGVGRASNGLKPIASGTRSMGRGGADIAWPGSATSMYSNPALLSTIRNNQIDVAPTLFRLDARYKDAVNSGVSSQDDLFPYVNWAAGFDLTRSDREVLEDLKRSDPLYRPRPQFVDPTPPDPIFGYGKILHRNIPIAVKQFPKSVSVVARGRVAEIYNIALVANYPGPGVKLAYSTIVATSQARTKLSDRDLTVASFPNLTNPLPDLPNKIVVYFTLEVEFKSSGDSADVHVLLDGVDAGNSTAGWNDAQPPPRPRESEPDRIGPELERWAASRDVSPVKFGIGTFVQAGAGSDFDIRTALYPEGTTHSAEFSFLSLAPTVSFRAFDFLTIGASLYLNYASISFSTPITQDASIEQGPLFPAGSLDAGLGGVFGLPSQFGPAMKYTLDTSPVHAPGTSITHTAKPDDPAFGVVTGKSEVKHARSFGFGGRLGLYADVTDRLKIGLTGSPPSFMQSYKGKARLDFNHQIASFIANPTIGHTNEVPSLFCAGLPTELRFTFNQAWNQGTVNVFCNNALTFPNFPLPNGPIVQSLPNGGSKGFAADYDIQVKNFQLPADLGIGFTYLLFDWMRVGIDYKHIFWAAAMKDFRTVLTNGSNPDVNALIGSDSFEIIIPQNWSDQNVIAVGLEFYPNAWLTLRCGWNYGNNPVPPETVMPIAPAITEHHATAGFSIQLGRFSIDAAYEHAFSNSVTVGQSLQTTDLNGSTLTVQQDVLSLGATFEF